jgi:hypothetical protein
LTGAHKHPAVTVLSLSGYGELVRAAVSARRFTSYRVIDDCRFGVAVRPL